MQNIGENIYKLEVSDIKDLFKLRDENSHKGMFGTVGIMGGSLNYLGAIKLASMSNATIRSGCGMLRVIVPEKLAFLLSPNILEATIFPLKCNDDYHMVNSNQIKEAIEKLDALAIGMGWSKDDEYAKILEYILNNYNGKLLIDADGLNTLSKMDLDILKHKKCKVILTPHIKEFERLTGIAIEKIEKNKEKIAMDFAREYNVILLLKGHTTIVTDGRICYLTDRGCAGMATAGSGDVLSGVITGLLGYNDANVLTVSAGAMLAGIAGEIAQEKNTDISMVAMDTVEQIPQAIEYIRGEHKYTTKITVGVILEKDNDVLLIKRKNTGYMDNMYGFLAGHVEKGESLKQAMIREAYEEGGIKIKEEDLEFVCGIRSNNHENYINFFFKAKKWEGEPHIKEKDKCEEIIWAKKDNLPDNIIENERRAIHNLENKIYLDEYNF